MSGAAPLAKFGIFAVICLIGAGVLVMELGNIDPFERRRTFEAVMPDAAGLLVNDPVQIAGVEVGKVESIEIVRGEAVVTFTVREDRVLGEDTEIGVRWRNLIGLRFLYLYPDGSGDLPDGHRFDADDLRTPTDLTAFLGRLTPIMRALDPEVGNIVVEALSESLSGREQEVRDLIESAASLLNAVADRAEETGRVIESGAQLLDAYAEREDELRDLISEFSEVAATVAERNDALVDAVSRIADGEEELERLVVDNDREIRDALAALDEIGDVLAANHDELEQIFAFTGTGIVQYHRISRWGQWFNIRAPGLSFGEEVVSTERGACLPRTVDPESGERHHRVPCDGSAGAGFFSGALIGVGDPGGGR